MKIITPAILLFALLGFSNGLQAERIVFSDRKVRTEYKADVTSQTILSTLFKTRKKISRTHRPWEIKDINFDSSKNRKLSAKWNEILSKYSKGTLKSRNLKDVDNLITAKPSTALKELKDIRIGFGESAFVWAFAAKVRILANSGESDTKALKDFDTAVKAWEFAVIAHGQYLQGKKLKGSDQPVGGKGHAFAKLPGKSIHASAISVWDDIATFYINAKQYKLAWEKGGQPVDAISRSMQQQTRDVEFLTVWGVPRIDAIATRIANDARVLEGEKAKPVWSAAESAYESMIVLAKLMKDDAAAGRAELALADAQIWTGKSVKARSKFNTYIKGFEKALEDGSKKAAAKPFGKTSPEVLALAFNGIGKIEYVDGDYGKALRSFARSLTNFSASKEARAEAVLYCGLCYAKMAADKKLGGASKKYLLKMADSMMQDLTQTLSDTAVFGRRVLLADAVEAAKAAK